MGNSCEGEGGLEESSMVQSYLQICASGQENLFEGKESSRLSTDSCAHHQHIQSELKEPQKSQKRRKQQRAQDLFFKVGGFIVIGELQTKEKRSIINGIGVVINGNKVLAPYEALVSKFSKKRYGDEQIYFAPFAYLETKIKSKRIFVSKGKGDTLISYCLIELQGQLWPGNYVSKEFFDCEDDKGSQLYRVGGSKVMRNTSHFFQMEPIEELMGQNREMDFEISSSDCQLSPIFAVAKEVELIGLQIGRRGTKRRAVLLTDLFLRSSANWKEAQQPSFKPYESQKYYRQLFRDRISDRHFGEGVGPKLYAISVNDAYLYFQLEGDQCFGKLSSEYQAMMKVPLQLTKEGILIPPERQIKRAVESPSQVRFLEKLLKYMNNEYGYFGLDDETSRFASQFVRGASANGRVSPGLKRCESFKIFYKKQSKLKQSKFAIIQSYSPKEQRTLKQIIDQWLKANNKTELIYQVYDVFKQALQQKYLHLPIDSFSNQFLRIIVLCKDQSCKKMKIDKQMQSSLIL